MAAFEHQVEVSPPEHHLGDVVGKALFQQVERSQTRRSRSVADGDARGEDGVRADGRLRRDAAVVAEIGRSLDRLEVVDVDAEEPLDRVVGRVKRCIWRKL